MKRYQIAIQKYNKDENEEALKIFEEELEKERSVTNLTNISHYYVDMYGNYERAKEFLEEAVEKKPKTYFAYAYLGEVYLELEEEEKAIKMLEKAYQMNPTDMIVTNLIIAYFNARHYEKAKEWLKKEKKKEKNELTEQKYCLTLDKTGLEKELIEELKKYEERYTEEEDGYYWVAAFYTKLGMLEDAKRCYEKEFVRDVYYMGITIKENYLYFLIKNGNEDKYEETIKKEIKRRKEEIKEERENTDETWKKEDRDEFIEEMEEEIRRLEELNQTEGIKKFKEEYQVKLEEKLEARQYTWTRCYFFGCEHCDNPLYDEK